MAITGIRQGACVRTAAKFQSAQGTPVTVWVDADILRVDDGPAPDPNFEKLAQQGTHGSLYRKDTSVIVATTPTVEALLKASPENIRLFMESLLGVVPSTSAGPIGTIYKFEGFEKDIPKYLTYVWDDTFESIRAKDIWTHTVQFTSESGENLQMQITGVGLSELEKIDSSILTGLDLVNFNSYSHKESTFFDEATGTPVGIALTGFDMTIEHGRIQVNANSVSPTFIGKDGRITVTGSLTMRLYDDTAPFFYRVLANERATYRGVWVDDAGKQLEIILRNVIFEGNLPTVSEDGTLSDFTLDFEAFQDTAPGGDFPFTLNVEN